MRRRTFIAGVGSAVWPVVGRAQQSDRMRRIGVLIATVESDPEGQARAAAFRQGIDALGWTESRNIRIDTRWAADEGHIQAYVEELVGLGPDVIVVNSSRVVAALQRATRTIPIVFAQVADPAGQGFVASLARPGGNVTGFATTEFCDRRKVAGIAKGDRAERHARGRHSRSSEPQLGRISARD